MYQILEGFIAFHFTSLKTIIKVNRKSTETTDCNALTWLPSEETCHLNYNWCINTEPNSEARSARLDRANTCSNVQDPSLYNC